MCEGREEGSLVLPMGGGSSCAGQGDACSILLLLAAEGEGRAQDIGPQKSNLSEYMPPKV